MSIDPTKSWQVPVRNQYRPEMRWSYKTKWNLSAGVPNAYYFGHEGLHNVLVIDLLGPSLEDLFDMCNRKLTIKTVAMVAKQMVSLLDYSMICLLISWTLVDFPRSKRSRTQSDLQRYQTRQLLDWTTGNKIRKHGLFGRLWHGQILPWSKDKKTYSLQRTQELVRNCKIHEYQYSFGKRYVF